MANPNSICKANIDKKVSVIMPVYNTDEYLNRCIDSILNQTYKNFELICVDDCSSDNSLNILKQYVSLNKNIKIIENSSNRGQSYCKNIALKAATGDYISFIDSDDFVSENFLEEMVTLAVSESADIIMSNILSEDKNTHKYNNSLLEVGTYENLIEKFSIINNGSCCDKLFSFSLIKNFNIDFPNNYFYEDNEFLLKAIYYANKLCTTNKCSYFYCYNSKSTTKNEKNYLKLKQSASAILEHVYSFYNSKKLTKKERNLLLLFCIKSICSQYITDDDFLLPSCLNKRKMISMLEKRIYKNIFQRIFSIINTTQETKIVTIFFIPIKLKRRTRIRINS